MPVTDDHLRELDERGFVLVPDFLEPDELSSAQEGMWRHYPKPEDYFANPGKYPSFEKPMGGIRNFPWLSLALNCIVLHPALIAVAERILGSADIQLCKAELLAKYAGAAVYAQGFHRDYGNHTLAVPRKDGCWKELTTIIYLSDITQATAATTFIPRTHTDHIELGHTALPDQPPPDLEERAVGPAGSLVLYFYDVFHRAVQFEESGASRFIIFADFRQTDMTWAGKHAFPIAGNRPEMNELVEQINARQRTVLGFPPPGHAYWNGQTIADTQVRYRNMVMAPYMAAIGQ